MRRTALIAALFVMLVIPITAQAATSRAIQILPSLSFNDATANCAVTVVAEKASDTISVDLSLWQGSKCVDSWSDSGSGHLNFSTTTTVSKGNEYKLTAKVTINGVAKPTVWVYETC